MLPFALAALFFALLQEACSIPSPPYDDEKPLELVMVLTRHGARSPTYPLSSYVEPNSWSNGPRSNGELTADGKQMLIDLGGEFRTWLIDGEGFLGATHLNFSHVAIRSSGMDRTVESAAAFVMGLYPDPDENFAVCDSGADTCYQPVAIQSVAQKMDPMLRPWDCCGAIQDYWMDIPAMDEFQQKQGEEQAFFDEMASRLGIQSVDFTNLEEVYDPLSCDSAAGKTLPYGIESADFDRVADDYSFLVLRAFTGSSTVTQLLGSALLREFADNVQALIDGEDGPRMRLYSGHDFSIMAVLAALGQFDGTVPPFASHLEVHVRRDGNAHMAAVSLNDEPIEVLGGRCENSAEAAADGLVWCSAGDLVEDLYARALASDADWDEVCGNDVPTLVLEHREYVAVSDSAAGLSGSEIALIVFTLIFAVGTVALAAVHFGVRFRVRRKPARSE
eukprot:gnl/Chilomastix_cuspidata/1116.p1 GENE.gnl/Chilomastix_cuspidata/1116~~gnl/Chilomastix_cuspidata/1116.p1  ORF type:complete len:448 (-),score=139.12 gnl/Chilomastix_cuspidata/1116:573-1916(-)